MAVSQVPHFVVHDLLAGLADANAKPQDGISVNACHALNAANAVPLYQHGDRQRFLFGSRLTKRMTQSSVS